MERGETDVVQQPQRIPAFSAPRMGNFTAFQHHMIDGTVAEATAHCETGVPGTDYDCGGSANGGRSQSIAAMGLPRFNLLRQ
jgi:hypothetical protein